MTDHNGVLTMQRLLLAGALGMSMARKAAAILEGEPGSRAQAWPPLPDGTGPRNPQAPEGAVLRAILDAANECLGHFDDRPPGERWCDALLHLLDLAAFSADLGVASLRPGRLSPSAGPRPPDRPDRRELEVPVAPQRDRLTRGGAHAVTIRADPGRRPPERLGVNRPKPTETALTGLTRARAGDRPGNARWGPR